jgi:hypothetical protein
MEVYCHLIKQRVPLLHRVSRHHLKQAKGDENEYSWNLSIFISLQKFMGSCYEEERVQR